jgi:spore maturation protein CgeB
VEIASDLSDLVDKVRFYLEHVAKARRIADAGYAH